MPKRNIVWIAIVAVVAVLLWQVPEAIIRRDDLYNQFSPLLDVRLQVIKHYVEETDDKDLLHGAIDGMLSRLDPYSEYYDPLEYEQFQARTAGQFEGIGIVVEQRPDTGELVIVSPIEGSPAFIAGLRAQDRIIEINGRSALDMTLVEAVKLIQGEPGTSVTLTIERPGVPESFKETITRSVVTVRTVRGWARSGQWDWDYIIDPEHKIGYVRISSFEGKTAEQLNEVLRPLFDQRKIRGLILDVRDNPGGLLDVVVSITDRFLAGGIIVSTKGRNAPEQRYYAGKDNTYPAVPLVVLVNGGSASASEILAGAIRDHKRGTIVGEKTFGKGSVQELIEIEKGRTGGGAVKLTTAYYYLPNGERIHGRGVVPTNIVELTGEQREAMIESQRSVYSTRTPPASQTATSSAPTADRVEILIDPQLQAALDILREKLTRNGS